MCGIIGYVGKNDATIVLIKGLHRLEYRGYDSAGIALITENDIFLRKVAGRVNELAQTIEVSVPQSNVGIAHTRWATHGVPNDVNAHPHTDCKNRFAVVHNGIYEDRKVTSLYRILILK
jgi:glucosamine--fructose-6-phosphate aminotransferase (isomerizing)